MLFVGHCFDRNGLLREANSGETDEQQADQDVFNAFHGLYGLGFRFLKLKINMRFRYS
jgi:hypothetical protein